MTWRAFVTALLLAALCGATATRAQTITDYTPYRYFVDRLPPLAVNTNPAREAGSLMRPVEKDASTYGPFASSTLLPGECFIFARTDTSTAAGTDSAQPVLPAALPASTDVSLAVKFSALFCVSSAAQMATGATPGTAFSFMRDIKPFLDAGNATWARRESWGLQGFSYSLCTNIDADWIKRPASGNGVVARFSVPSDLTVGPGTARYACREHWLGFFSQGLPAPPNHPNPAQYVPPNPTVRYHCVNHTVYWNANNPNPSPQAVDVGQDSVNGYWTTKIECVARDAFADTYLDEHGNVRADAGTPTMPPCDSTLPEAAMSRMVERCTVDVAGRARAVAGTTRAYDTVLSSPYAYACEVVCRYPCVTYSAYTTAQSQAASAVCAPEARALQCTQDVRTLRTYFCNPTESLAVYQVHPNRPLNAFDNDVTTPCAPGALGCRALCHCRGVGGCPNHPTCSYRGTLHDSAVVAPSLTPACMCEPGRTGDTCEKMVSTTVCNRGQEL